MTKTITAWSSVSRRQFLAASAVAAGSSMTSAASTDRFVGVAVVELFTSQGCSSCPPADAVLRQIAAAAKSQSKPIFALSYHVDYWNRLGWTDPYSQAGFSKRQRQYAMAAGSRRVYTPQMIVNGTTEFNGSHSAKADQAIGDALGEMVSVEVDFEIKQSADRNRLEIDFEVIGEIESRYLNVALVSTPPQNDIRDGENGGRTLSHVNVVRRFRATRLEQAKGIVNLSWDGKLAGEAPQVIAFVQDPRTRQIVGATAVEVG